MSNIIPIRSASRADVDETAVTEQMEQIPGQIDLDLVIKAQLSAPQVTRRIAELEDCLWAVASDLMRFDPASASIERAKLLLNNHLEVGGFRRTLSRHARRSKLFTVEGNPRDLSFKGDL
jgi:hypothetical protein